MCITINSENNKMSTDNTASTPHTSKCIHTTQTRKQLAFRQHSLICSSCLTCGERQNIVHVTGRKAPYRLQQKQQLDSSPEQTHGAQHTQNRVAVRALMREYRPLSLSHPSTIFRPPFSGDSLWTTLFPTSSEDTSVIRHAVLTQ